MCVCVQDLGFGIVDSLNLYTVGGTLIGASWFVETVTITYEVTAFVTANGEPVVINEDDNELLGGKNAAALSSAAKIQLTESCLWHIHTERSQWSILRVFSL